MKSTTQELNSIPAAPQIQHKGGQTRLKFILNSNLSIESDPIDFICLLVPIVVRCRASTYSDVLFYTTPNRRRPRWEELKTE